MRIDTVLAMLLAGLLVAQGMVSSNAFAKGTGDNTCKSTAYTESLVDILKNGLPATENPKHVIVIGAGIAGLTGATLLKNAGHNVTVLEASNRAGGRILTYREADNKYYVDLGAMRILNHHKFSNTYVERYNLSTSPFIGHNKNVWYYINGKKAKVSEVDSNPDIFGFQTSQKEKGKSDWQLFEGAIQQEESYIFRAHNGTLGGILKNCEGLEKNKVTSSVAKVLIILPMHFDFTVLCILLKECLHCGTLDNECLKQYDNYSMQNYLAEEAGLSKGAISMLEAAGTWEGFMHNAFTEAARDYDWGDFYEIDGGADALIGSLVSELDNELVYNAKVTSIEHGNGSVVAYYPFGGKDTQISGDYILTTVTPRALSFIKFIPKLDNEKREAIRNVNFPGATKIALVFQRPFWEDEGIVGGGKTITDLPSRAIYYPSHGFDSGLGVLFVYIQLSQADKFLGLTDEGCLNQALNDIAEVHGDYIRELYVEGVVKRWTLDPHSHGAFTWFTPYQLTNLWAPLVRPTDNVFFAGEHTSFTHAWIDTAIRSAVEAANCISTKRCYPELVSESAANYQEKNVGDRLYCQPQVYWVILWWTIFLSVH